MEFFNFFGIDTAGFDRWQIAFLGSPGLGITLVLVVLCVSYLLFSWRGSKPIESRRRGRFLLASRTLFLTLLVLMILQPALEFQKASRIKNKVAILVDTSESMGLKEAGSARLARVKEFFQKNQGYFDRLEKDFDLDFFGFSLGLQPTSRELVEKLKAVGRGTDLGKALQGLKIKYEDKPLSGALLFSDGADQGDLKVLKDEGKSTVDFPAPIYAFGVGETEGFKDIALREVLYDDFGFIKTPLEVEVKLSSIGYPSKSIPITLKREGRVILSQALEIKEGQRDYSLKFQFIPEELGKLIYHISVPVYSGEAITTNNEKTFIIKVIRDKIRVLHIAGHPSWDVRFLRRMLKNDPNIDLISFFILRTTADLVSVPQRELSLIPFPTHDLFTKELKSFDLLIFQNFGYRPYVNFRYLRNIKSFVVEKGGAFMMIGGENSFSSGGYDNSPIEEILPVDLSGKEELASERPFLMKLTREGLTHPITSLDFDLGKNQEIWEELPKLSGWNVVGRAKPGATVLGEHPVERASEENLPILAVQDVGKGRTLALATDSSWYWNFINVGKGGSNRHYLRFWANAIRWLIRDPELKLIEVSTEKTKYAQGEEVKGKVRVLGKDYRPAEGALLKVEIETPSHRKIHLNEIREGEKGDYLFNLSPEEEGFYRIRAEAGKGDEYLGEDETIFSRETANPELEDVLMREDLLMAIAQDSGGKYFPLTSEDFEHQIKLKRPKVFKVTERRHLTIWNRAPVFFLIIVTLCLEWWLRRRWGVN
jgi:uncharacterized membrane protein